MAAAFALERREECALVGQFGLASLEAGDEVPTFERSDATSGGVLEIETKKRTLLGPR